VVLIQLSFCFIITVAVGSIFCTIFFGVSQAGLEINRDGASYFNYIFAQALIQTSIYAKMGFFGEKRLFWIILFCLFCLFFMELLLS
jgi:hypothetical protein